MMLQTEINYVTTVSKEEKVKTQRNIDHNLKKNLNLFKMLRVSATHSEVVEGGV